MNIWIKTTEKCKKVRLVTRENRDKEPESPFSVEDGLVKFTELFSFLWSDPRIQISKYEFQFFFKQQRF